MGLQMQAEKKRRNRRRLSLFKETYQMSTGRPNTEDRFAGYYPHRENGDILSGRSSLPRFWSWEFREPRTVAALLNIYYTNFFPLRNTLSDRLDGIVGRR